MGKDATKATQLRKPEILELGKGTPCAAFCSGKMKLVQGQEAWEWKKRGGLPERREPKPAMEMQPWEEAMASKSAMVLISAPEAMAMRGLRRRGAKGGANRGGDRSEEEERKAGGTLDLDRAAGIGKDG